MSTIVERVNGEDRLSSKHFTHQSVTAENDQMYTFRVPFPAQVLTWNQPIHRGNIR